MQRKEMCAPWQTTWSTHSHNTCLQSEGEKKSTTPSLVIPRYFVEVDVQHITIEQTRAAPVFVTSATRLQFQDGDHLLIGSDELVQQLLYVTSRLQMSSLMTFSAVNGHCGTLNTTTTQARQS